MTASEPVAPSEPVAATVRERIGRAGLELFLAQGYDNTTVDAISQRAGVGRRTFFRHFRSKDDVLFAWHEKVVQTVSSHLDALGDSAPLNAVCSGTRIVLRSYVEDPVASLQRYELIRSVPALRDREIAWVSQYTRLFAGYLRTRLANQPDGDRMAEVAAAAVVAAHNHVLRQWLRSGAVADPFPELDEACAWVVARVNGQLTESASDAQRSVVAVFRSDGPIEDVVQRISRSL